MATIVNGIFDNFDTDQDGILNQIESDSGLAKLGQEMKNIGGILAASGSPLQSPPPEKVFEKADTNKDGVVKENANSGTDDISGIGQNWKSEMFNALLKILSTTTGSTVESTSLYT